MELRRGWELAGSPAGALGVPADLDALSWRPAEVPGTVGGALGDDAAGRDLDAEDWWFRVRFPGPGGGGPHVLELDGLATVAEVYLNGTRILLSESMWLAHAVDVTGVLRSENELVIAFRALAPLLARRRRPAARWRTRVASEGNLRWVRTMVFGRSPGFAPAPAPVGPWRAVRLTSHEGAWIRACAVRATLEGERGAVRLAVEVEGRPGSAWAHLGEVGAELRQDGGNRLVAELALDRVEPWWPHTHGEPVLYDLSVHIDAHVVRRRVGFRTLDWPAEIRRDGLALRLNGTSVFARGAVWTPPDLVTMAPAEVDLRRLLGLVRDAGMNMVRIPGLCAYETEAFHSCCDELGLMVWQDLMFANLDYPFADEAFRLVAEAEVRAQARRLVGHPSTAVVCGNNEIEQQPAMMGLDPSLGRADFFELTVPELLEAAGYDGPYVPSTPTGGALPFHADAGVTHYFGVSGYFQATDHARRAEVRFASECLAFANVPDDVRFQIHDPRWKRGVVRNAGTGWDRGAGWDFDDVRDGYLEMLYGVEPVALRRFDSERYFELSRFASGEVMAEVIGEWRRAGSPCQGALVLWLKDMYPGAGLGVLDHTGRPKVAYHHLRRAMAPLAVWMTDEGVNGVAVHLANDRAQAADAELRLALYRRETLAGEAIETVALAAHDARTLNLEAVLGRFTDAAWTYRFGPPGHDAVVATLSVAGEPVSQAFRFPAGRPLARRPATELGLQVTLADTAGHGRTLALQTRALVYGIRLEAPGWSAADNAFSLEPGARRMITLTPDGPRADDVVTVHAINLETPLRCRPA